MSARTGRRRLTLLLAVVTAAALAASLPGSVRDDWQRGGLYVFSREFLDELPRRLSGPGRFRFLLQPAVATAFGMRAGLADARVGKQPYLWALLAGRGERAWLLRDGFDTIAHLLLAGILADSVSQWLIYGSSHPGAALEVGPVLIAVPYAVARALANRYTRLGARHGQ